MADNRKGKPKLPVPADELYKLRAAKLTWAKQARVLGVSESTIARWWRELGQEKENPRGVSQPPTPSPFGAGLSLENFDPKNLEIAALRVIANGFEAGGSEALRAAGMGLDYVRKAKAEVDYFDVLSDKARAAVVFEAKALAARLQAIADPVTAALAEAKGNTPAAAAATAWLVAHPEDVELERLYRASAAATAGDEERKALEAWIEAHPC